MLDTGVLGKIVHPRPQPEVASWLLALLQSGAQVIIPEIADYELRRNLLLERLMPSIQRLDQLKGVLTYRPIDTDTMLRAAALWAQARAMKPPRPTADPKEPDGDAILAAQALEAGAVIATDNVGHLGLFAPAQSWSDMT